jgi:hypothetical protein
VGQVDGDFNGANVIALLGAVVNQRYGLRHLRSVVGLPATGLLKAPDFSQEKFTCYYHRNLARLCRNLRLKLITTHLGGVQAQVLCVLNFINKPACQMADLPSFRTYCLTSPVWQKSHA